MTIYGRSEELVSRCVECDLAEPESLASLGGSAPGLVDGILSIPDGRVKYRYYTIQEYKDLSNEQKKELKDLHAYRGHKPERRKFNKASVKGQLAALEQQVSVLQSNHGANAQKVTQSGTPAPANASTNSENANNCNHPALTCQQA